LLIYSTNKKNPWSKWVLITLVLASKKGFLKTKYH